MKYFDGYDPVTGNLIEAKKWDDFPPDFLMREQILLLRQDAGIATEVGSTLEIRMSSERQARLLRQALEEADVRNIIVRHWPVE